MGNALVIMTKAPLPGEVKTRLAPVLSPEGAAELSGCFLLDALELAKCVGDCDVMLAYAPYDGLEAFPPVSTEVAGLIPQVDGDLGHRMRAVFETLFDQGYARVVLIGTDMPTLPLGHLEEAFSLLDEHPVVLGPAMDGGYYLIGLRTMIPEIFEGIEWGTNQVLRQTNERLVETDIQPEYVLPWYDVDTPANLNFLIAHLDLLRGCRGERLPEHTLAFLEGEGLLTKHSYEL